MVFQADEVEYDDQLGLTVAKGHVEISQGGEVLLADTVSYNQRTDTITASGPCQPAEPTGEVVFADFMELRDSMNNAFAQNVRMLLADRSRLAANAARRLNGNRIELRRGVYSPCDLCKDDPSAPPAWQFKAREITDDKELKLLEFRDAIARNRRLARVLHALPLDPRPQPKPLSQPMRSGRTMLGSCALLNTIDISAPTVARMTAQPIGWARSGRLG